MRRTSNGMSKKRLHGKGFRQEIGNAHEAFFYFMASPHKWRGFRRHCSHPVVKPSPLSDWASCSISGLGFRLRSAMSKLLCTQACPLIPNLSALWWVYTKSFTPSAWHSPSQVPPSLSPLATSLPPHEERKRIWWWRYAPTNGEGENKVGYKRESWQRGRGWIDMIYGYIQPPLSTLSVQQPLITCTTLIIISRHDTAPCSFHLAIIFAL